MRGLSRKIIAGGAMLLISVAGLATSTTASAAPGVKLSTAERQIMQAQVDAHLKRSVGGKQIGLNQIAFHGGDTILTLPLPGETQARAIDEPIGIQGTANCAFAYACLYTGTNFDGGRLSRTVCALLDLGPLGFSNVTSSIHNNQTNNTQTYILNSSSQILNANRAPSKVNDVGVGGADRAVRWRVC